MKRWILVVVALWCLSALPVAAQTPVTASDGIAFTPSSDHAAVHVDGTPILTGYTYEIITTALNGPGVLFVSVPLLKPDPNASGEIVVRPISAFGTLAYGQVYTSRVVATGPGGSTASALSESFARPVPPAPAPGASGVPRLVRN